MKQQRTFPLPDNIISHLLYHDMCIIHELIGKPKKIIITFILMALLGPIAAVTGYLWLSESSEIIGAVMLFASGGILYSIFSSNFSGSKGSSAKFKEKISARIFFWVMLPFYFNNLYTAFFFSRVKKFTC